MTPYIITAIVIFLAVAYWRNRHPKGRDIDVPAPATLRTDLLYGYYGCETGQALAVKDHTNLHWECQFHGIGRAADDILTMHTTTVLDVMPQLFEKIADHGKNYALRADAEALLLNLFDYLRLRGALQYVWVLVPLDEPNTNCRSPEDMMGALNVLRAVAARYSELSGVKFGVVYASAPLSFTCIEQFDRVAVCDPEGGSSVLQGAYQELVKAKRPDAKTFILPYGAFGQDPAPFINWAHADSNVAAVVPFCWFGPREPADKWTGIGAGPLRGAYEAAGRALIGGQP